MAKILNFPNACRRRLVPPSTVPMRYVVRPQSCVHSGGFGVLLFVTIPAVFFYLFGVVNVARHDGLYVSLLVAIWGVYFFHDRLLRIRVLGPVLMRFGQLLLLAGFTGFFGSIYWLIFTAG